MTEKTQYSIHPRNWPNFGNGKTKNTMAPRKRGRVFKKVEDRFIRRINDHEAMIKSLPSNVNPMAFRKPGSRNPTKLHQR